MVGAAKNVLRVTSRSRRPQTVGVPTRFQSQAVPPLPHARASSPDARHRVSRKRPPARPVCGGPRPTIPRKREAASSIARHRESPRWPPARPRKGDRRKIFHFQANAAQEHQHPTHTRERHRADARHRVSPKRPPARPFGAGPARPSPPQLRCAPTPQAHSPPQSP